jgi:ATP-dependent DNA helicase DinG
LLEDDINRKVDRYWVCQKRKGAFPKVLEQALSDRSKYLSENRQTATSVSDFIKHFPFPHMRNKQSFVLREIEGAFASGYKHILLEAPTGFGKSAVAVAVALALRSSHLCTSTTELQMQYATDFPFLYQATGMGKFPCLVKDFIRNQVYQCRSCGTLGILDCSHKNVDYGTCHTNASFKHDSRACGCSKREVIEHIGCKYRTFQDEYAVSNVGTIGEQVFIDPAVLNRRRELYDRWSFITDNKFTRGRDGGYWFHSVKLVINSFCC